MNVFSAEKGYIEIVFRLITPKCQRSHLGPCQKTLTQGEPNSASNQLMNNSQSRALLDRTQPRFKGQS
ncbi:hypothetical protein T03_7874 [Trichinella britovi]|uniref:Uncharacterized protein n=1 Tax=Trichinella britovi TaxID=45882 RepID=A0A0V1C784_TRIBR|nr:hypothetical protein T03_7874 [Trichinella britovi]